MRRPRWRAAASRLPSRAGGLVAALAVLMAFLAIPAATSAESSPALRLYVEDAPLTRNATVRLALIPETPPPGAAGSVIEYRASNDGELSDGVLTNGVSVPAVGDWALASGPDGPRTIHGQLRYENGAWSPVASLDLVLDTSPRSAIYVDLDPQPGLGYELFLPPGTDWHTWSATPDDPIHGRAIAPLAPTPAGFVVGDSDWSVYFHNLEGPVTAGTYDVPAPIEEESCGPICAGIEAANQSDCGGRGQFTIHDIEFTAGGDLLMVDADFRLYCFSYVMAGSIRYGSARTVPALDQTIDSTAFGLVDVGTAVSRTVTFTSFGSASVHLGTAGLVGLDPGDFDITADSCSGETMRVGETCSVTVTFAPTTHGRRSALLEIADDTARGYRTVVLGGSGVAVSRLELTAPRVPQFGPATATIVTTVYPAEAAFLPRLWVDGAQAFGPTTATLSDPSRAVHEYSIVLSPGEHEIVATLDTTGDFRAPPPQTLRLVVGTKTELELSTATDDGVAAGETAELIARLRTGAPLTGGTLRILDGTGATIASTSVSGSNPSLTHPVTRGLGSYSFRAEFVPASPDVQAAEASYDLVVVSGTRPETQMDPTTHMTSALTAWFEFSSPDSGVSFQCRYGASNLWFSCTSPQMFHGNPGEQEVLVRATRPNGLADRTPATRTWIVDVTPPQGGPVTIAGGASATNSTSVIVDAPASDLGGSGLTHLALSNDGSTWVTREYARTQEWTLPSTNGTRTVHVKWRDGAGTWSWPESDSIILDTAGPSGTVTVAGGAPYAATRDVTVTAPATDALSTVSQIRLSNDGATWTTRPYAPDQAWTLESGDGTRSVHVQWRDAAGTWSGTVVDSIVVDTTGPSGAVSISDGSRYTGTPTVAISVPATDALSGVAEVALSNDNATWTTRPYSASQTWTLAPTDGVAMVHVRWRDGAGSWSSATTGSIVLDRVGPVVSAPDSRFTKSPVSGDRLGVLVGWSGSDGASGIARYVLAESVDGGSFRTLSTTLTSPQVARALATGHTYRYRVQAVDRAGNVGAWVTGPTFRVSSAQNTNRRISWNGTWRTALGSSHWGGSSRYATAAGAKATITVTGRSFAWVSATGPTRGWARVYVDGTLAGSVNLYSATSRYRRVVFVATWATSRTRTVTIRVVGTRGHPRVDVDAFSWLS